MSAISAVWLYVGWGAVHFETNYGLMQHSPSEIKEKLLKALDKEYNVVDMSTVVEIISILERTPITKEALETTRLGRYVNELRRKTTNDALAKRAKDLVRRWRDMILPQQQQQQQQQLTERDNVAAVSVNAPTGSGTPQHLHHQNGSSGIGGATVSTKHMTPRSGSSCSGRAKTVSPTSASTSPALSMYNTGSTITNMKHHTVQNTPLSDAVPKTHASNKRLRKEMSKSPPDDRIRRPAKSAKLNGASFIPELGECSRDGSVMSDDRNSITTEGGCETVTAITIMNNNNGNQLSEQPFPHSQTATSTSPPIVIPSVLSQSQSGVSDVIDESAPVAPRRPGRQKGSKKRSSKNKSDNKFSDDIIKEKIACKAKTPRVKTHQELVAGLEQHNAGEDSYKVNVEIASDSNRGTSSLTTILSSSNDEVTRNKTEHIKKFLCSQPDDVIEIDDRIMNIEHTVNRDDDNSSSRLKVCSSNPLSVLSHKELPEDIDRKPISMEPTGSSGVPSKEDTLECSLRDLYSRLPPIDPDCLLMDDELSESPPISPAPPIVVTEEDIDRLHEDCVDNLNGNFDHAPALRDNENSDFNNEIENDVLSSYINIVSKKQKLNFREWHEMVSRTSYNGDLLHILPYVVID